MTGHRATLLSVDEVAMVFSTSPRTLRRWARKGILVPIQVGGSLYYPDEEVDEVISSAVVDRALRKFSEHQDKNVRGSGAEESHIFSDAEPVVV